MAKLADISRFVSPDGDAPPLPNGPAVLAAITGSDADAVRASCSKAVANVGRGTAWTPDRDVSLTELDHAFNDLGWLVSRVSNYRGDRPTLAAWMADKAFAGITYYADLEPAETWGSRGLVALLDGHVVSADEPAPVPVEDSAFRDRRVGQVFVVAPAASVRWAN